MAGFPQETHLNRRKMLKTIGIGSMAHMVAFPPLWAREASKRRREYHLDYQRGYGTGPRLLGRVCPHTEHRSTGKGWHAFHKGFGAASVCMPNRTAMITGVTQTTVGSVTMRPPKEFMRPLSGGVKPEGERTAKKRRPLGRRDQSLTPAFLYRRFLPRIRPRPPRPRSAIVAGSGTIVMSFK